MPATISATLSSAKPAAAAERPVKALSSEITTGMSAPPIGSTTRLPSRPAASRIADEESLRGVVVVDRDADAGGDDADQQDDVDHLLAGNRERPGRDQVLELGEGDVRAPEGDRADDGGEEDRDQLVERDRRAPSAIPWRISDQAISATAPPPTPL